MRIDSFDPTTGTLDVTFSDGTRCELFDVPEELHNGLNQAESQSAYFDTHLWNKGFEHRTHWRDLADLLRYLEEHMNFEAPCTVHSIRWEDTPLHTACVWGDIEAVRLLVDGGADVNARGDLGCTPLYEAVSFDHVRCAALLLSAGATDSDQNELSCTALERALRSENPRMRALFVDQA
jgi:uncharacterized protein